MRTFKSIKDLYKDPTSCVKLVEKVFMAQYNQVPSEQWPYEVQINIDDADVLTIRIEQPYGTDILSIPVSKVQGAKGSRKMFHKMTFQFEPEYSVFLHLLNDLGYSF